MKMHFGGFFPFMLVLVLLLSPVSAAEAAEGNVAVLTSDEIADYYGILEDGATYPDTKFGCTSYIDCTGVESITLTMVKTQTQRRFGLAFYDADKKFLSFVEQVNQGSGYLSVEKTVPVPEGAKYFRTTYYNYEYRKSTGSDFRCVLHYKAGITPPAYRPYQDGQIYFSREINQSLNPNEQVMKATTGVLALPKNYTPTGEKTKLIVYFHGYSHGVYMDHWGSSETFLQQKQHFLDRGYAVMGCNGARDNNKTFQNTNSSAGSRQYVDGFWQCCQYIFANYNIDPQVYVVGGSAGGPPAINFSDWHSDNVRALMLLSPWTDLKVQSWGQGIREPFVEYLGFADTQTYETEKTLDVDPALRIKYTADGTAYIDSIKVPVRAFVGANDTVVSMHTSLSAFMDALKICQPEAQLKIWEGRGHEIVSGAIAEVDTAVCDFFDEVSTVKNVSILGDSISTFQGVTDNGSRNSTITSEYLARYAPITATDASLVKLNSVNDTWWMQTINKYELNLLVNNAWRGTKVLDSGIRSGYGIRCENLHDNTLADNPGGAEINPDIIAIHMGTNDYLQNVPAGTFDLSCIRDNADGTYTYGTPTTFAQAYGVMLHKIQQKYPHADIFCFTLSPIAYKTDTVSLEALNQVIRQTASHFGAQLVDLYADSGITAQNAAAYLANDKIHPNEAGIALISQCFGRALEQYYGTHVHTEVIDEAVAPTCTAPGKTQGRHCSVCAEIIAAQQAIPAKGHTWVNGACACGELHINTMWEIGTITSAAGQNNADKTRLRTVDYLKLEDYAGVGVNSGYTMANFVYDADQKYLGTSSWLGSGQSFTTQALREKYPTGVYFRVALRTLDSKDLTQVSAASTGVKFYAPGETIPGKPESDLKFTNLGSIGSWQDGAIFDGKLFVLNGSGSGRVFAMDSLTILGSFTLDKTDVLKPHANSVCFGSTYYAQEDKYPLLYVNVYNNYASAADRMEGTCCVYRITESGGSFTTKLVQVIKIGFTEDLTLWKSRENNGDVRPYGNFVVDTDLNQLYAYVMRDKEQVTRFFQFDIPALSAGSYSSTYGCNVVTLNTGDIRARFDTVYISYMQGVSYSSGKILSAEGFHSGGLSEPVIRVIDLETRQVMATYYAADAELYKEPEVICTDPDTGLLYYAPADGVLRQLRLTKDGGCLYHAEVIDKAVEAACTTTGLTEGKHCSVCNAVIVAQQTIPAKGHTEVVDSAVAATCTTDGRTEGRHCTDCGTVLKAQEPLLAVGHTWDTGIVTTEPTETTEGEKTFTCTACGETRMETLPKLNHVHQYTGTVTAPTCTEDGYTTHTCACGDSYTNTAIPAAGHTEEAIPPVAPTCTAEGKTEGKMCVVCGTVTIAQQTLPVIGHTWDAGIVTTEPTETTEGEKTFTCTACGETRTETLPKLSHVHQYTGTVTAPTCTEDGYTTHTCACGDSYTDTAIPAAGHTEEAISPVAPTCTAEGKTEGKMCVVCGTVTIAQQTLPVIGHTWDTGIVTTEPTETTEGEKTFTCTACGETRTETLPKLSHVHQYTGTVTAPTCTEDGYTTHSCTCGDSYKDSEIAALGHSYENGKCKTCGEADPNWTEPAPETEATRLAGAHRFETAFLAANQMKQTLGIEKFDTVVVASGMDFADALSGSYLAAVKNAPILLACDVGWINELVKDYIKENVHSGGTVYILGGTKAIPDSFKTGLEGFSVQRLAGDDRFLTNLKVLEEAGVGGKPILIATGLNFADCLSASAAKQPILLVYGDKLLDAQATFLEANKGRSLYIIGGTGAVGEKLENQIKTYGTVERLAGGNRFETSVMIARKFFTNPDTAVLAYAGDFPDGLCGGSLAAAMNAPLILTMPKYEAQATEYIQGQGIRKGFILGGEKLIPDRSAKQIFDIR